MLKIPRKVREMPWPGPYESENRLMDIRVTVNTPVVDHERLLVVTLQSAAKRQQRYAEDTVRIVCSKKQQDCAMYAEYSARAVNPSRLREKININLATCYPDISEREEKLLAAWLGEKATQNHYLDNLRGWLDAAEAAAKRRDMELRGELLDDDWRLCPKELPEGFVDWLCREVIARDDTIIYKRGNTRGLCYACGRKITGRFSQNFFSACPECGTRAMCFLEGGAAWRADYVSNVAAAQLGTDGKTVFIRLWHLKRDPSVRYERPEEWLQEIARYAMRGRHAAKWQREYKESYIGATIRYPLDTWERYKNVSIIYDGSYKFYDGSLPAATAGTLLQYSTPELYYEAARADRRHGDIIKYLLDWTRCPIMEYLVKRGFYGLVVDKVNGMSKDEKDLIRWRRDKLGECFRFPVRLLKGLEPGALHMRDINRLGVLWRICQSGAAAERDIPEFMALNIKYAVIEPACRYAKLRRIIQYLQSQTEAVRNGLEKLYMDYIRECEQLHLDLSSAQVLFPRDLIAAHTRTSGQIEYKRDKMLQEGFAAAYAALMKYAWQNGGLLIRPAASQDELIAEGEVLNHCVGGYAQKMAEGKTAIFFIRREAEPDTPFYTLELIGKEVIQCRTRHNASCDEWDPDVAAFVKRWLAEVVAKGGKKKKKAA